jgi:hypothetical protein
MRGQRRNRQDRASGLGLSALGQRFDLRLDLGQGGLQGRAPSRVRSALRQNVFALQMKSLTLPFLCGSRHLSSPTLFFIHQTASFNGIRFLQAFSHQFPLDLLSRI